jgi:hypothetical protein
MNSTTKIAYRQGQIKKLTNHHMQSPYTISQTQFDHFIKRMKNRVFCCYLFIVWTKYRLFDVKWKIRKKTDNNNSNNNDDRNLLKDNSVSSFHNSICASILVSFFNYFFSGKNLPRKLNFLKDEISWNLLSNLVGWK